MQNTNYEVRELKKVIIDGKLIGLYLVLRDNQYVSTVEFDYFYNVCSSVDHPNLPTDIASEECEACEAVANYIATKIRENNIFLIPPAPSKEDLDRIFG